MVESYSAPGPVKTSYYNNLPASRLDYSVFRFSGISYRNKKTNEYSIEIPDPETILFVSKTGRKSMNIELQIEDIIGSKAERNELKIFALPKKDNKAGPRPRVFRTFEFIGCGRSGVEDSVYYDSTLIECMQSNQPFESASQGGQPLLPRPKRLLVFVNPFSGTKKGIRVWLEARGILANCNFEINVIQTERRNHARDVVKDSSKVGIG
jgi:hypothetical protein